MRKRQSPIVMGMQWVIGGLILGIVGIVVRRALRIGSPRKPHVSGLAPLCLDLYAIYHPIAQEVEAHATILGITLNDAFGEREANRHELAWHVVGLAMGEWDRLTGLVVGLLNTLAKHVPNTKVIVPVRRVAAGYFKSRAVIDYVGFYEFLDQILFSSKRRFSLQLRVLFRTCVLLTKEFRRTYREGGRTLDASAEVWNRLDFYFHDFDLIAKETLLAFRTLLICQPPEGIQVLADDLQSLLERGVRVSIPAANQ
jgi:hypothetical protein